MKKIFFPIILIIFSFFAFSAQADTVGESVSFNVQEKYDSERRSEISATYIERTSLINFYIESNYWSSLDHSEQKDVKSSLIKLSNEFKEKTYPTLTGTFGSEWKPGIDDDEKITVLFHEMRGGASGYFNSGDQYKMIQVSDSNEREMVYLNPNFIGDEKMNSFLAHEFMHLITFNQKERNRNVSEEVWLNEARAEYVPSLLDYEINSILEERIDTFSRNLDNPLCEWGEREEDYGIISVFIHYLAEHYGIEILVDSLKSSKAGIESINYALEKNGFQERFNDIFTDWAITVLINDCEVSEKYCYENEDLKNLRITPSLNLMSLNGKSSLVVSDSIKNWSGKWYKFAGGKGDLEMIFAGSSGNIYQVPYVINYHDGEKEIGSFDLDSNQKGEISISDFGTDVLSVTVIPLLQTKTSDFSKEDSSVPFIIEASTISESSVSINFEKPISEMDREEVEGKISQIENILNQLKERIAEILGMGGESSKFENNLYYGARSDEVERLQQFLSDQGEDIYPEELVTGNFLSLTKQAVIRFQEKYSDEILEPLGLEKGTGYFGPSTRKKVNELLGY
jgi:hypothetical protein